MSNAASGMVVGARLRSLTSAVLGGGLLTAALVCLVGCLTVDATLKADGSGKIDMTYPLPKGGTEASEKQRFSSPHVKIESLKVQGETGVLSATFDDVTKLASAEGFKTATVTRARDGDDERLTLKMTNSQPIAVPDKGKPGPKITIALPGKVRDASKNSKIDNDKVTWTFSFAEFAKESAVEMTVRYAAPPVPDHGGSKDASAPK